MHEKKNVKQVKLIKRNMNKGRSRESTNRGSIVHHIGNEAEPESLTIVDVPVLLGPIWRAKNFFFVFLCVDLVVDVEGVILTGGRSSFLVVTPPTSPAAAAAAAALVLVILLSFGRGVAVRRSRVSSSSAV